MKKAKKLYPKKKEQELIAGIKTPFFPRYDTLEAAENAVREFESKSEGKRFEYDDDEPKNEDDESQDSNSLREENMTDNVINQNIEDFTELEEEEGMVSATEASRMLDQMRRNEAEDDEFEKAFRAVMQDSIENAGKQSSLSSKAVDVNMARPAVLPKPKNVFSRFSADEEEDTETAQKGIAFKLLSRDNKGKVETRQLLIPEENQISLRLAKAEAARREARLRLKQQVLNLDSQFEDEELDDAVDSRKALLSIFNLKDRANAVKDSAASPGQQQTEARDMGLSDFLAESNAAAMRRFKSNFHASKSGR